MPRSTSGVGRSPRARLDQSAVPEQTDEGTIVLGRQPDEKDPAPAKKSAAKSS